jgi:adenosylcobyric acid synthase
VLVGDIDRGGVIASLVGTKTVVAPEDAALIAGFIVNKFRGDPTLFADGMKSIEQATGWQPLGLVPFFDRAARLPAEDALALDRRDLQADNRNTLIVVLAYPRVSNFDDFDPLRLEPHLNVVFLKPGEPIPGDARLVILPGSKATIADLAALRATGWDIDIAAHIRRGGHVLGICGGYQMLGKRIADPQGIEGAPGSVEGLGHLDVETMMTGDKTLVEVEGATVAGEIPFMGYEMHVGRTAGPGCARPYLRFANGKGDGAVSADGHVAGCYVHGLFADDRMRAHWLARLGAKPSTLDYEQEIEATLDALASHLEQHIAVDTLLALAREPALSSQTS